jgi:hypothetical protein
VAGSSTSRCPQNVLITLWAGFQRGARTRAKRLPSAAAGRKGACRAPDPWTRCPLWGRKRMSRRRRRDVRAFHHGLGWLARQFLRRRPDPGLLRPRIAPSFNASAHAVRPDTNPRRMIIAR